MQKIYQIKLYLKQLHNIANKLRKIFSLSGKRTAFTNSELDSAIVLDGLTLIELKRIAKKRMIKNYDISSKDQLCYTLITSKKTPLEDKKEKYLEQDKYLNTYQKINT